MGLAVVLGHRARADSGSAARTRAKTELSQCLAAGQRMTEFRPTVPGDSWHARAQKFEDLAMQAQACRTDGQGDLKDCHLLTNGMYGFPSLSVLRDWENKRENLTYKSSLQWFDHNACYDDYAADLKLRHNWGGMLDDPHLYCGDGQEKKDCVQSLEASAAECEALSKLGPCVYYAAFHHRLDKQKQAHDAQCQKAYQAELKTIGQAGAQTPDAAAGSSAAEQGSQSATRSPSDTGSTRAPQGPGNDRSDTAAQRAGLHATGQGGSGSGHAATAAQTAAAQRAKAEKEAATRRAAKQKAQQAAEARYHQAQAAAAAENTEYNTALVTMVAGMHGGGTLARGPSFLFSFGLGAGLGVVPLLATDSGDFSGTSTGLAFGTGPALSMGLWPLFSPHLSLGFEGEGLLGVMAAAGGGYTVLSARGSIDVEVGDDSTMALLVRYGHGYRAATLSTAAVDAYSSSYTNGNTAYSYDCVGGGVQLCFGQQAGGHFCQLGMHLLLSAEQPDFANEAAPLPVFVSLDVFDRRDFSVGAQLAWSLPVQSGSTVAKTDPGVLFTAYFRHRWDMFSDPYFGESDAGGEVRAAGGPAQTYLVLGGALLAGGVALDLLPASGHNHSLQPLDLVPLALYAVSATAIGYGVYLLW